MENYTEEFIEEEFRKVASGEIQYVSNQILGANSILNFAQPETNINCETTVESLQTSAATLFANSIEHGLKANIIFDDFRRHSDFRQDIGHQEWRNKIAGFVNGFEYLGRPKDIRTKIIMVNDPNDPRSTEIKTTPDYDQKYRTLNFDTGKVSGHTLDSYYQLQNSIPKMLINTEYFLYVTDEIKYTVYALLTEDILSKEDEKTIIPMDLYDGLKANKNVFPTLRFSGISGDEIKSNDLTFLNEFSSIVLEVGKYRFSLPKIYSEIDFEKYKFESFFANNVVAFQNLDKMAKYYLQSCFTEKEIEAFVKYIENTKMDQLTLNVFVNNAIYLKNVVKNRMQINLEFTEKQFARIDLVCDLLKAFQAFDPNAKRLCDNEFFAVEGKKQFWIEKTKNAMIEKKEEIKSNANIDLLKEKYPSYFTSVILGVRTENEVVEFLMSEEFKNYSDLLTPEVLIECSLNKIKEIIASEEFKNYPHLFSQTILLHSTPERIREIINSEAFKAKPQLFNASDVEKYGIEEIYSIAKRSVEIKKAYESALSINRNMLSERDNFEYYENLFCKERKFTNQWYLEIKRKAQSDRENFQDEIKENPQNINKILEDLSSKYEDAVRLIYRVNFLMPSDSEFVEFYNKNNKNIIKCMKYYIGTTKQDIINKISFINRYGFYDEQVVSIEDSVNIFIEMLNEGNRDILIHGSRYKLKGFPQITLANFFSTHKKEIEKKLFNELKDNPEYETARKLFREYEMRTNLGEKIGIFIEMLNEGNSEVLRQYNNETLKNYPNIKLSHFWTLHKKEIKEKLFIELKDNPEYETARQTVNSYEELKNLEKRKNILRGVRETKSEIEEAIISIDDHKKGKGSKS